MPRLLIIAGAIAGFLAVALGAFAAHGLRGHLDAQGLQAFQTAADYQMYHALALLAVGILALKYPARRLLYVSGAVFVLGIVLFSGSLYALVLTQASWLGPVTPIGGTALLIAWLLLAASLMRR